MNCEYRFGSGKLVTWKLGTISEDNTVKTKGITGGSILPKALFTRREGYPSKRVTLARTHYSYFLRCVYKAARITRVVGLPYLRARVTLASGLTFSPVNTPGRECLNVT